MNRWTKRVPLAALGASLLGCASADGPAGVPPPRAVDRVNLERYVGTWHQIAHLPNRFQASCARDTTARYALRDDGRIDVENRCIGEDGEPEVARGIARVVEGSSNARLEVSFFSILGWRPVWGDYWILGLGETYDWAVVGTPDRRYGWILARAPTLPEETRERVDRILAEQGYDPEDFVEEPRT